MLVVMNLIRSINAHDGLEVLFCATVGAYANIDQHSRFDTASNTFDIESFEPGKPQSRRAFTVFELQREHSHSDEIAAVNPFEAFCQHRFNAKQARALSCPIARG